ncbi:MAG: 30S ribosomal protein S12 methylthiotransferase RimO [Polyangiaceae bacterium]|nr:30S ribosomal protein S12 methylthiotransferase RimO [Polyangiaceae bacterium]
MPRRASTIHFVSLGCPKNRVDTEVMLGLAEQCGYRHVADPTDADVIVVNTCGFVESARQESIDTILELAQHRTTGKCRKLVVTGCLSQRYPAELAADLPEVDHLLGSSDMLRLREVLAGTAPRVAVGDPASWLIRASDPRRLSTRGASAYVKLAEGCDRKCAFCVIPSLRGRQRSRAPDDLLAEVHQLARAGVREVNLVAQDTVAYGRDLAPRQDLPSLVARIAEVPGIDWIRLHYLYPDALTKGLLSLFAEHPRVVPYVDMPLQHAADAMLRRMRRGHGRARLRRIIETLRERIPEVVIRTAFIVGHPGETEAEFDELRAFVAWAKLDRVGVFRYSNELDAPSSRLPDQVPAKVAERRARQLMKLQCSVSRRRLRALVGRELDVLVEGPSEEHELVMVGRYYGQAPEVDGCVYLSGAEVRSGEIRRVRITKAADYDLLGEVIDDPPPLRSEPMPSTLAGWSKEGRRVTLRTVF